MIILKFADEYQLEPEFIKAIIAVESAFNPLAVRYEPTYQWIKHEIVNKYADLHLVSHDTEMMLNKCSLGLMQVMGSTLRDLGHMGHLLDIIATPELGIRYGAKFLARLAEKYPDMKDVAAAYNAGSPRKLSGGTYINQDYVDKVMEHYYRYKKTNPLFVP